MSVVSSNEAYFELNKNNLKEIKENCENLKSNILNDLTTLCTHFDDNKNSLVENFKDDKSVTGHNFDYIELMEVNFDIFYDNYKKIKNEIKKARRLQFYIDDIENEKNEN
jgi:hypothetical protein